MRKIFTALAILCLNTAAQALTLSAPLEPFKATYSAEYNGRSLKGTRQLSVKDGQWRLASTFKTAFVSLSENSTGSISEALDLDVQRYDYVRKIFGIKKRQYRIIDSTTGTVTFDSGKQEGQYEAPAHTFDTASQQLYIQEMLRRGEREFSMSIAARTNLKHSRFQAFDRAPLTLPIGTIEAIKVERLEEPGSKRHVVMWFSPEHNYQLVKLRQTETDGKHYEIRLTGLQ